MSSDEMTIVGLELAVEEGEAVEGEEDEEDINPVLPEIHEILWPAIFFVLLWVLMKYVLLPPIHRITEARRAKEAGDRDAADAARTELGRLETEYREAMARARASADEMVAAARDEAEAYRREQIHAAEAEITARRLALDEEIQRARAAALESLRPQVTTMAVGAASRILDRPLDEAAQVAIVDRTLGDGG